MNTQEINELSINIAVNLLTFLAEKGVLRHNQIHDIITDMDTNTTSKEYTREFAAMIMGAAPIIRDILTNNDYDVD